MLIFFFNNAGYPRFDIKNNNPFSITRIEFFFNEHIYDTFTSYYIGIGTKTDGAPEE